MGLVGYEVVTIDKDIINIRRIKDVKEVVELVVNKVLKRGRVLARLKGITRYSKRP